jgi:neutral ceramidase
MLLAESMRPYMQLVVCGILLGLGTRAVSADTFSAGAATADLTPGEGVSLDGPISKPGPVRGVYDPLTSRALVLQHGATSVLIVVNDMCMIDREVYDAAKKIVHEKTGIPVNHQLMAATHSHATPRVVRISTRPPDEAYRSLVAERIAQAAVRAFANLAPAKVGFGTFSKPDIAACRRSLCKAGSVGVNPFGEAGEVIKSVAGKSDAVIGPAGAVDPDLSVLSVQHADGRPMALLGNLSVHYCGGYAGGLVSADYFGCYARRLESRLSSGDKDAPFVGIMSNATSGDIGSFRRTEGPNPPWSRMKHFGGMLAEDSLELLGKIKHQVPKSLNVVMAEISLNVRKPNAERIDWATRLLNQPNSKGSHRWSRIYAQEAMQLHEFPDRYDVPLQAIRLGNIGIAAAPCEVFSETGLAIKANSPFAQTMTMELANGYSGYLPSEQQHGWGGYETWPARSSHLEVTAEAKIKNELLRLLQQLR